VTHGEAFDATGKTAWFDEIRVSTTAVRMSMAGHGVVKS